MEAEGLQELQQDYVDAVSVPSSNHLLVWLIALGGVVALGFRASPWYVFFGITCVVMFYLAVADLLSGIYLFLILNPLTLWIRNAAPGAIVLSGATSIWLTILIAGWILNMLRGKTLFLALKYDVLFISIFIGYSLSMCFRGPTFLRAFVGFRYLVFPSFLYLMMRAVVPAEPERIKKLPAVLCVSAAIMAVVQLLWYKGFIQIDLYRFTEVKANLEVLGGVRTLFGFSVGRMHSAIGGGPSNAAIYLSAGAWLGLTQIFSRQRSLGAKFIFLALVILTGIASLLAISRSAVLLSVMVVLFAVTASRLSGSMKLMAVVTGFFMMVAFVFGRQLEGKTIIGSIQRNAGVWLNNIPTGLGMLFGNGFYVAGGALLRQIEATYSLVDAGWVLVWFQVGLVGFMPLVGWIIYFLVDCSRLIWQRSQMRMDADSWRLAFMSAAIGMGLLVGSVHTDIISRIGSNMMFYAVTATLVSLTEMGRNQYLFERQQQYEQYYEDALTENVYAS